MKLLLSIAVLSVGLNGYAQSTTAVPAQPASNTPTEAVSSGATSSGSTASTTATSAPAAIKKAKAAGTSTTKAAKPAPPKSPWSASTTLEVARATDINHSKILDEENPDKRVESSLALSLRVKYKINDKNSISLKQAFERDLVKNPSAETENEVRVKNLSVTYVRATDMTVLGSGKIALPYILSLPTTYDSRKSGMIGALGFAPAMSWELNPTFSLTLALFGQFTAKSDVAEEYSYDKVMEKSTLLLSNSLTLGATLSDMVSISQTLGITSMSRNYQTFGSAEQIGAQLDVSSGISFAFTPKFSVDASVTQAAPVQGSGFGTKVYESNLFRLYHVAQTSYGLAANYSF